MAAFIPPLDWLLIGAAVVLTIAAFGSIALSTYFRSRGKRLITCPETTAPAAVDIDALHAVATSVMGGKELRLKDCSRWPERQGCGQECLVQIENASDGCLVRSIVGHWYRQHPCAVCGTKIEKIDWAEQRPGLIGPHGQSVTWTDVAADSLPALFASHQPVCWSCHVLRMVDRSHPGLFLVRPGRPGPRSLRAV